MRKKNNSKKGNSQFDGKINDLYYQIKKYETLCYETINERLHSKTYITSTKENHALKKRKDAKILIRDKKVVICFNAKRLFSTVSKRKSNQQN